MNVRNFVIGTILAGLLSSCSSRPPETTRTEGAASSQAAPSIQEITAEQIAFDPSWGNTEGPALDSANNLYFCSRGTYKGIIRWNAKDGAQRYLAIATKAGPGSLWIDPGDHIFLTATDERTIMKVSPKKIVT